MDAYLRLWSSSHQRRVSANWRTIRRCQFLLRPCLPVYDKYKSGICAVCIDHRAGLVCSSKQSACYTQCIRVCVQMSAQLLPLAQLTAASFGTPAVSSVCDRCKHGIRAIDLVHCTGLVCHSMQSAQFTAARLGVPAVSSMCARRKCKISLSTRRAPQLRSCSSCVRVCVCV